MTEEPNNDKKESKKEEVYLYGWTEYLGDYFEWRKKNEPQKTIDPEVEEYLAHVERVLRRLAIELKDRDNEILRLEKELNIIKSGKDLENILVKMDEIKLQKLKIQVEDRLKYIKTFNPIIDQD